MSPPHSVTLFPVAMTSSQPTKRSTAADVSAAATKRRKGNLPTVPEGEQQLPPPDASSSTYSDICTNWAANPAFDSQRVLLGRLFFINGEKTKYVSVGLYPARDYQPLVEFGVIRRCGSKSLILTDEQVYTLAECLPKIHESMCKGEEAPVIKCESGSFRLITPRSPRGLTPMYLGTDYMSDVTGRKLSGANVSRRASAIARLHTCYAGLVIV